MLQNLRLHVEAKEKRRFTLCFPSAGNVQPLPRKKGFSTQWLLQETNVVILNAPHLSSFHFAFIAEQTSYGIGYPFAHIKSVALALSHLEPTGWQGNTGDNLDAVWAPLGSSQNTAVLSAPF